MDSQSSSGRSPSRRSVLKGAVGVGVGATVWSSPSIHGIARTPAFAAGSVICQNINSFQWNTSSNILGWNGQPCSGSNPDPYTVDPTGGASVCAGAWGDAQVKIDTDVAGDQVVITIENGSLDPNCYIVKAEAFETNGSSAGAVTPGNTTTKTVTLDMSGVTSANKRLDIEIDCASGLGC
jgi:hypothetical protein